MAEILKVGKNNFFVNEDGSVSMMYDPMYNKVFIADNGTQNSKTVPIYNISIQRGGQIYFKINNEKYIIDDGYRDRLLYSGYLALNRNELVDPEIRSRVKSAIINSFRGLKFNNIEFNHDNNSIKMISIQSGYQLTVEIESINKMIDRNIKRAKEKLPMYPTIRGMSKSTSLYFRVYARRLPESKAAKTLEELSAMCKRLIKAISTSNNFDFSELKDIYGDKKYYFKIIETRGKGVILKWEDDL